MSYSISELTLMSNKIAAATVSDNSIWNSIEVKLPTWNHTMHYIIITQ